MELQELYTSFLPKKVKNDKQQYIAPSQIYLSSNMQKLKLLRMEKERKKSQAGDITTTTKHTNENQQVGQQNHHDLNKDDFKRSKSFNQSPNKNIDSNRTLNSRNPSIPFEQYVNMQMMNQKIKQQTDENSSSNLFQNSLLSQINNKGNQLIQLQPSRQNEKNNSNRKSALNSRNMYQQSIVILDQNGVETKANEYPQNFSQIMEQQKKSQIQNSNIDLSYQFAIENSLVKESVDYSTYQKEIQEYKQFMKKCQEQREKSPMNVYFQKYSQYQQNNHYDKYYPHYQTKIEIPSETNPEKKLEEVMGGKMRSYLPSEMRNTDFNTQRQLSQRQNEQQAQRFIVNSKIMENNVQVNNYSPDTNFDYILAQTNQMGVYQQTPGSRQQRRGKSSISSSRPTQNNNVSQPISTKVIKPPLSIQAHLNKDNIVVTQNIHEITVNGEKQTYIIPLQQNYSVCLNEIDRIKARRKLLLSKRGLSSNGELQPFSQEDSKQYFISRIEQSRQTPKNDQSNLQKSFTAAQKNYKSQLANNESFFSYTIDSNQHTQNQQQKKQQKVDFNNYVQETNQVLLNNSSNNQRKHLKSYNV